MTPKCHCNTPQSPHPSLGPWFPNTTIICLLGGPQDVVGGELCVSWPPFCILTLGGRGTAFALGAQLSALCCHGERFLNCPDSCASGDQAPKHSFRGSGDLAQPGPTCSPHEGLSTALSGARGDLVVARTSWKAKDCQRTSLSSQDLNFLSCKMGMIIVPAPKLCLAIT